MLLESLLSSLKSLHTRIQCINALSNLDEFQRHMREIFIEIRTIQEITDEVIVTPRAKHDVVIEQKIKVRKNKKSLLSLR